MLQYYPCSMERLPNHILQKFRPGEDVMRHKPGLWNSIWSDMYIESTCMRKGHGPGDIIGVTLNNNALKWWSLSLHKCSRIISYRVEMTDANAEPNDVTVHQEEMPDV